MQNFDDFLDQTDDEQDENAAFFKVDFLLNSTSSMFND